MQWNECGTLARSEFSAEGLPWNQNTVESYSQMSCAQVAGPPVAIPVPLKLPTEISLPQRVAFHWRQIRL